MKAPALSYPLPTNILEVRKIKLTSPLLRIGDRVDSLSPFEYVQSGKAVYIPDADLLARELYQRGYLKDFLERIKNREELTPLLDRAFGDDWAKMTNKDARSLFPTRLQKWTEDKITDLRPMIRNGWGRQYIPGSSIKGAIRTAITYYLLKHGDRFQTPKAQQPSALEQIIRERMKLPEFQQKYTHARFDDELLIDPLFTNYQLSYQNIPITDKLSRPNTDFMRAVKISDSAPLLEKNVNLKSGKTRRDNVAIAAAVTVSSHFGDDKAKRRATIYAEMALRANTTFTITLDRQMLSWFQHQQGMQIPFSSIDDLLQICQEFAQEQWDAEHDYWETIINNSHRDHQLDFDDIRALYEPEVCPYRLRLGWASGMNGTTIGLCLPDDLRQELRDQCGIKAPGFAAPKSRRTVANVHGEIKYAPGWVKLEALS
jgi:CRISPR-associated protein Csm5